jgi:hypothetical protein
MSEKELGRALLGLDCRQLAGVPDVRAQTWKILERDRRRVWWLTALTIALWAVAILMVLGMLVAFGLLFPFQAHLAQESRPAQPSAAEPSEEGSVNERIQMEGRLVILQPHEPRLSPEMLEAAKLTAQITFQMITVGVTCSVGVLALAALSTVFLVLASRRATLRQITASLLEISQQLKDLRQPAPPT